MKKRRYINLGNAGRDWSELQVVSGGDGHLAILSVHRRGGVDDPTATVWLSREQVRDLYQFAFGTAIDRDKDWYDV